VTSSGGSFGDAAAEMANESEVEVPTEGASASAGRHAGPRVPEDETLAEVGVGAGAEEISGVDNWLEEGGPLEPEDVAAVAAAPTLEEQLAERTVDLQRVHAEYANYRKRVDRDRQLVSENAAYQALVPVLDVLDTIDRARESARSLGGELDEGFRAVADQLERAVGASGLTRFGAPGDAFDPTLHEALSHIGPEPGLEVTTVKVVAKAGYRLGDRVVRAAQVLVADPE